MCYKDKCMCLAVETGALVFAIINVMITSLGTVISFAGIVYTTLFIDDAVDQYDMFRPGYMSASEKKQTMLIANFAANIVFIILAVGFCIAFAFAVVLIVGLCKRKASLVKCYFVYGVMKMVCGVAFMIMAMRSDIPIGISYISLFMNIIYGLILYMVHLTYKKFESEIAFHSFSNPMAAIQKF